MKNDRRRPGAAYAAAGVDIDAAASAKERIKARARSTFRPEVLSEIGPFAGLFELSGYKRPVLVSSADGVGTKLKIAFALDRHDTVGIDLVNHCVNDIFTCGAEPLFFLDYIAMGKLVPDRVESIVSGLSAACTEAGCALIGGETAEMPGIYAENEYDLAGFIVGVIEKAHVVDTSSIQAGDVILGLASSGLHTNGYSLVRRVFGLDVNAPDSLNIFYPELGRNLGQELLEPHRAYYPLLKGVVRGRSKKDGRPLVKGMAHITGGGLYDNVARILPPAVKAVFHSEKWQVPPIFKLISDRGDIGRDEMYRVFNMGIGMVLVCSPAATDEIADMVPEVRHIGEIVGNPGGKRVAIL